MCTGGTCCCVPRALVAEAAAGDRLERPPLTCPPLVRRGYGDEPALPATWQAAAAQAHAEWDAKPEAPVWQRGPSTSWLGRDELGAKDLAGLHDIMTREPGRRRRGSPAVVRDGPESAEVILVRAGRWPGISHASTAGPIGPSRGAAIHGPEITEAVVQSAVRLPSPPFGHRGG